MHPLQYPTVDQERVKRERERERAMKLGAVAGFALAVLVIMTLNVHTTVAAVAEKPTNSSSTLDAGSPSSSYVGIAPAFYEDDNEAVESTETQYVEETSPVAKTNVYVSTGVMVLIVLAICGIGIAGWWCSSKRAANAAAAAEGPNLQRYSTLQREVGDV